MERSEQIKNLKEAVQSLLSFNSKSNEVEVEAIEAVETTEVIDETIVVTEEEFATNLNKVELKDGTCLYTSSIEVGTEVFAEDQTTPATDGSYETMDGTLINVSNGVIEQVTVATDAPEMQPGVEDAEMSVETDMAPMTDTSVPTSDVESRLSNLENAITKIMEILSNMGDVENEMMAKVEEFSKQPSAEPISTVKLHTKQLSVDELRVARMLEIKNSLR